MYDDDCGGFCLLEGTRKAVDRLDIWNGIRQGSGHNLFSIESTVPLWIRSYIEGSDLRTLAEMEWLNKLKLVAPYAEFITGHAFQCLLSDEVIFLIFGCN